MRILHDEQVQRALAWQPVLASLRRAFTQPERYQSPKRVVMQQQVEGQHASYLTMPCSDTAGWFGVKQVTVLSDNPKRGLPSVQAWYTLCDPTGRPVLACEADNLTRIRTAAVSALAADYLAPTEARTLLMVGTGSLAPHMVAAHLQVRDYQQVRVWGRSPHKAQALAEQLRQQHRQEVVVYDALHAAVQGADVISVATTARTPLLQGAWLEDSSPHIDIVGAFLPEMAEVDTALVQRAHVVVDDRQACQHEAGDLIQAAQQGWDWSELLGDLSQLVQGTIAPVPQRPTLFKSVGLAFEDLVVAKLLLSE